jgi:hypothetical protein
MFTTVVSVASDLEIHLGLSREHCCVRCCRKRDEKSKDNKTHDCWTVGTVVDAFCLFALSSTFYRFLLESWITFMILCENFNYSASFWALKFPHRARERPFIVFDKIDIRAVLYEYQLPNSVPTVDRSFGMYIL